MRIQLSLLIAFSVCLAGCYDSDTPIPPQPDPFANRPQDVPRIDDKTPISNMENAGLIQSLGHADKDKRREAEDSLVGQGPAVIPELIEALSDENWHVRAGIILTLGRFGREAKDALPTLREIKENDEYEAVRASAAFNIAQIQGSEDNLFQKNH